MHWYSITSLQIFPPWVSGIHCAIDNSRGATSNEVFTIHMTMSFENSSATAHFSQAPRLSDRSFKVFSCIIVFMFCFLTFILGAQRLCLFSSIMENMVERFVMAPRQGYGQEEWAKQSVHRKNQQQQQEEGTQVELNSQQRSHLTTNKVSALLCQWLAVIQFHNQCFV